MRARVLPGAVLVVVVAAMIWPAIRHVDSFPLSTYPMFADDAGRTTAVDTASGLRADGTRVTLSPQLVTGTTEVILAAATVSRAIQDGRADALSAEVAGRVAASGDAIPHVEIATQTFDAVDYFASSAGTDPTAVTVHATCTVPDR